MAIFLDAGHPVLHRHMALLTFDSGQWLGWTGMVRVDGVSFVWMGAPKEPNVAKAIQTSFEYTSTKSIFTMHADNKVSVKVTFLSPLTPTDFERQSLIFSYMNVEVSSLDGSNHNVQIYTDISAGQLRCARQVGPGADVGQNGPLATSKPKHNGTTGV
jgi:hypothetical protein